MASPDEVPLSELLCGVVDNRGRTCPTTDSGIPLIATNCVRNDLLYPAYEKVRYVDEDVYRAWFRGHPLPGDLIFVTKGTPGRVCLTPEPVDFCIAQDMVALRADPDRVYPKYLFALLRSAVVQRRIEQMHVGTLIPHFKKGDFDKLLLPIPERRVQELVGDTYVGFSAKIELNRRMSETLEGIARALFKSWFVDFDPARAKAEGRATGLPKQIDDLFPDSLKDSALGEIPSSWRVGPITELAALLSGGTPKTDRSEYWNGGVPWASAKDVSQSAHMFLVATDRTITARGLEESATQLIPALSTVVVARGATTGRMALLGRDMAMNQTCYALMSSTATPFALYCLIGTVMGALVHAAHGSAFDTITTRTFAGSSVVLAPTAVLRAFEQLVSTIFTRILWAVQQSVSLAAIRDALLPKLISGELRVKDADRLAEASA